MKTKYIISNKLSSRYGKRVSTKSHAMGQKRNIPNIQNLYKVISTPRRS